MLEKICKAELSDLQDIAALESEIFSDAWSLKKSGRDMESEECSDICSKDRGENCRLSHYLLRIR